MNNDKICSHPDCDKTVRLRGFCQKHYLLAVKLGQLKIKHLRVPNEVIDQEDHYELVLTDRYGEEIARTKIDKEVLNDVLCHRWSLVKPHNQNTGYSATRYEGKLILLHRFLTGFEGLTDHINGDGLDNRLCNLREATHAQNVRNSPKQSTNKVGYKGVSLDHRGKKRRHKPMYRAQIKADGKYKNIGRFHTAIEAARAYDKAAKELHGEFARLNFPDEISGSPSTSDSPKIPSTRFSRRKICSQTPSQNFAPL